MSSFDEVHKIVLSKVCNFPNLVTWIQGASAKRDYDSWRKWFSHLHNGKSSNYWRNTGPIAVLQQPATLITAPPTCAPPGNRWRYACVTQRCVQRPEHATLLPDVYDNDGTSFRTYVDEISSVAIRGSVHFASFFVVSLLRLMHWFPRGERGFAENLLVWVKRYLHLLSYNWSLSGQ